MLPHPGQVRNEICAPCRAQSAAASTTAVTLRRRYIYRKTPDGCEGGPSSRFATLACYAVTGWTRDDSYEPRRGEAAMGCHRINFRYYSPTDGRWVRRNPIGIAGGINTNFGGQISAGFGASSNGGFNASAGWSISF